MAFVDAHRDRFGVEPICAVLVEHGVGIAPSTYYAARKRPPSGRDRRDEVLCELIARVHRDNYDAYGAVKIWEHLNRVEQIPVARCTVERLMGRLGIEGIRRGRRARTTTSDDSRQPPADLVERDFAVPAPDRLWLADLTYVRTRSGFVYAAFVIDAFSRRVLGWQASRSLRTDLALDALEMAIHARGRAGADPHGVIHHSDRGSQYLSIRYSQQLADNDIVASVGSKGDSYDNSMIESFNGIFKWELIYNRGPWHGLSDVEYATLEWVDWYNHRRLHGQLTRTPRHTTPAAHENAHYSRNDTADQADTHNKQSLPNPA